MICLLIVCWYFLRMAVAKDFALSVVYGMRAIEFLILSFVELVIETTAAITIIVCKLQ